MRYVQVNFGKNIWKKHGNKGICKIHSKLQKKLYQNYTEIINIFMQNGALVPVTKNLRNDIYDISCTILGTLSHRTNKVVRIIFKVRSIFHLIRTPREMSQLITPVSSAILIARTVFLLVTLSHCNDTNRSVSP